MIQQFGDHAAHLLELAVGYDERPVVPIHEAKSIGNETTFRDDISDADHLQAILDHLVAKVARRLRSHGFKTRTVTLTLEGWTPGASRDLVRNEAVVWRNGHATLTIAAEDVAVIEID